MNFKFCNGFALFCVLLAGLLNSCSSEKLLFLMVDGFRWDYYANFKERLPGLTQFIAEGVNAEWVEPIFPSGTYASVTTMATGVYPETHGIIGSYLMNRSGITRDEKYFDKSILNPTSRQWLQVEPIWITTMKQHIKTFMYKWPMSNTPFERLLPENAVFFDGSPPKKYQSFESDLDDSLKLLTEDYSFVMQYYSKIDNVGHHSGPDSPEILEALIKFDQVLQNFINKLKTSSVADQLNIIIASDHGMTNIGKNSGVVIVKLTDYINLEYVDQIMGRKSLILIAAANGCIEKLYHQLKTMPGVDVYKKEKIPDEFHLKNNDRVLDILVMSRPGYLIQGDSSGKQIPADGEPCACNGYHGYANMTDMRAIFYARGPAFKKGYTSSPIRIEDEYQIMAKVLEVSALHNNNGSWARVSSMFV